MARESKRPATTCLISHQDFLEKIAMCKRAGCKVALDDDAGTLQATYESVQVVRAIQKGAREAPWIVSFYETDNIKWSQTDGV